MTISQEEAIILITPSIREKLRSSMIEAFQDYNNLDISLRLTLCATTRANFINDRICFHIRDKLGQLPGIDFIKRRGRWHLIILGQNDVLEVKFKKLDFNRRTRNMPTYESEYFLDQVQLEFPNMLHPITNIIAGYQINATRTGIRGIFVVCPYRSQNKWEIDIPLTAIAPLSLAQALSGAQREFEPSPKQVVPKTKIVKKKFKGGV